MLGPYTMRWLLSIDHVQTSPCPPWEVVCHTSHDPDVSDMASKKSPLLSVRRGERFKLIDMFTIPYSLTCSVDGVFLELENASGRGWSHLRYCEILPRRPAASTVRSPHSTHH